MAKDLIEAKREQQENAVKIQSLQKHEIHQDRGSFLQMSQSSSQIDKSIENLEKSIYKSKFGQQYSMQSSRVSQASTPVIKESPKAHQDLRMSISELKSHHDITESSQSIYKKPQEQIRKTSFENFQNVKRENSKLQTL